MVDSHLPDAVLSQGRRERVLVETRPDNPRCRHCGAPVQPTRLPASAGRPSLWYVPPLCGEAADDPYSGRFGTGCQGLMDAAQLRAEDDGRAHEADRSALKAAGLKDVEIGVVRHLGVEALEPLLRGLSKTSWARQNWVYVCSREPGCGKTTQLQLAVTHYLGLGWRAKYATQADVLASLRPGDGGGPSKARVEDWVGLDLLALDELGTYATAWGGEELRRVLDGRYSEGRCTLFASNHDLDAIGGQAILGARIADRITECVGFGRGTPRYLVLGWSWRRNEAVT